ncbi:MAG: hypothetical protein LKG23_10645 [Nitrospira sp.]|jgi:hypothetical protein|nr:hypothetical protein [Nitrospira sp.]
MPIDFGQLGFAYTLDLCTAIEKYTARETARNHSAFQYRGMDLRYAVERYLYIRCVNSETLFAFYAGLSGSAHAQSAQPMDFVVAKVAHEFIGASTQMIPFHPLPLQGWSMLRWLYGQLRERCSPAQRPMPATAEAHVPILFHVVHQKFASYLRPVVRHLTRNDYAYLVSENANLASAMEALGEPYLFGSRSTATLRSVFLGSTLRGFHGLVEAADRVLSAIRRIRPRCVVVVEGNAPLDSITAEVCRLLNVPTLCVQQGWSPVVHSGFRNMSFDDMFVWGEAIENLLQPFNPRQRFTVTGSHALHARGPDREGSNVGALVISFFLQAPCALLSARGYEDFIGLIIGCAASHSAVRFIVREHPSYPVPARLRAKLQMDNIRFSAASSEMLGEVIRASSLVVSVFSTVLLEAIALDTVPLICSIGSLPHYEPDLARLGAAIEVSSLADAREVIDKVVRDAGYLAPYKDRLAVVSARYFRSVDAGRAISDRIKAVAGISGVEVSQLAHRLDQS